MLHSRRSTRAFFSVVTFVSSLFITGCLGGGSGGGTNVNPEQQTKVEPVLYTGKTDPAPITEQNANKFFATIIGSGNTEPSVGLRTSSDSIAPASTASNSNPISPHQLSILATHSAAVASNQEGIFNSLLSTLMREVFGGQSSGSLTIDGLLSDSGTGTLTLTYVNYNDGDGVTWDGKATLEVRSADAYAEVLTDYVFATQKLTIKTSSYSESITGQIHYQFNIATNIDTLAADYAGRNELNGETYKFENFVAVVKYDQNDDPTPLRFSGRVYLANLGYVDITSNIAMPCDVCSQNNPELGGPFIILGANNTAARLSRITHPDALIQVDANGDSQYESENFYSWDSLDGPPVNGPPVYIGITLPNSAPRGQLLQFFASATDYEGDTITYSMVYGPTGMLIDGNGKVRWIPTEPMLAQSLDVRFAIRATSNNKTSVIKGSIIISDPTRKQPWVRTGAALPTTANRENTYLIADFDGDGENEILTTDQGKILETFVYSKTNKTYRQNWVYPFDISPNDASITRRWEGLIQSLDAYDVNHDGRPDMVVVLGSAVVILDGVTRAEIAHITDSFSMHYSAKVADLNGDGSPELVYLASNDMAGSMSTILTLRVINLDTQTLLWQSAPLNLGMSFAVANVDNDSALEIVTPLGYVFDGATFELQWNYTPGFSTYGRDLATGDIDGDGISEILASETQYEVPTEIRIFDGRSQSLRSSTTVPCTSNSLSCFGYISKVENIDLDPIVEVLLDNQAKWTAFTYDSKTNLLKEKWTFDRGVAGVPAPMQIGDTDNDGSPEIIADGFVIVGFNPTPSVEWNYFDNETIYAPFTNVRVLKTTTSAKALFFSPSQIIEVDGSSNSTKMSQFAGQINPAITTFDYDNNGNEDLFIFGSTSDTSLEIFDTTLRATTWTSSSTFVGTPIAMTHADINGDGHDDAVFVTDTYDAGSPNGAIAYAYDVFHDKLIWESAPLPAQRTIFQQSFTRAIAVNDLDRDEKPEIIVGFTTGFWIFKKDISGSNYVLQRTTLIDDVYFSWLSHLVTSDFDGDGISEIAYTTNGGTARSVVTVVDGMTSTRKTQFVVDAEITELSSVTTGQGRANLIAGLSDTGGVFYLRPTAWLTELDAMSGEVIWKSPPVVGVIRGDSLVRADIDGNELPDLVFSTDDAMYIVH